jgi:hypothetical protein
MIFPLIGAACFGRDGAIYSTRKNRQSVPPGAIVKRTGLPQRGQFPL